MLAHWPALESDKQLEILGNKRRAMDTGISISE